MSGTFARPRSCGRRLWALLGAIAFIAGTVYLSQFSRPSAQAGDDSTNQKPVATTTGAVAAADAFLHTLDAKQRDKALYDFDSNKKPNWSNLPANMVPRNGMRMGDLSKEQRAKALAVVAAVLSKEGYQKVVDIMDGDQKLVRPGGRGPAFGLDEYYLAVFGKPDETKPWMVQFGGHHLGLNVTVIGKHFVVTPTHTGAQPTLFQRDGKDVRPLGMENDTGFKLVNALDDKQRAQAILSDRPQGDLLLGPGRDGRKIEPKGIKGSGLTPDQRLMLLDVIAAWVNIAEPNSAAARMAGIKDKISDTYFAWNGPTEKGKAAYFRVHGPTVVIEYAPQGGTDHIHTIIRNPEDDYGAELLKR